ncbi:hypothetical protein D9M72_389800 [compost metagenome]
MLQPFFETLEGGEDHARIGRVGERRTVEAGKGDGTLHSRDVLDDLRRPLDHRIGAVERGTVWKLDDDDCVTLVHGRHEAARHDLCHVPCGPEQAHKDEERRGHCRLRRHQFAHDPGIAFGHAVETVVEAVGQCPAEARQRVAALVMAVFVRLQEDRRQCRRQRQRIEGRDHCRHRDRHGELQIELAGDAGDEGRGHEDGGQHQRDRDNSGTHFVHGHMRGFARGHAAREVSLDVLDDHDRIVDDDTDRQHQAEQRQHVQREAEGVEEGEGADQRHGDGDDRDDRRAPGLQEDENDDGDEQRRFADRLVDLVDRFRNELGRIVDDPVFEPFREITRDVGHHLLDLLGSVERIGARPREDAERHRRAAVEIAVVDVFAGTELDAGDILQLHEATGFRRLDDDVAKLPRIAEATVGGDGVLEGAVARRRRTADRTAGDLHVLLAQRLHHVTGRHAIGGQFFRSEPDTQRIFALAEQDDVADAVEPHQQIADARAGIVRDVELVITFGRREQMHDHHQVGRALGRGDADASDLFRQARFGDRHAVLHQHLCLVEIGAELEGNRQRHRAVSG